MLETCEGETGQHGGLRSDEAPVDADPKPVEAVEIAEAENGAGVDREGSTGLDESVIEQLVGKMNGTLRVHGSHVALQHADIAYRLALPPRRH